jgi:ankyrin repeat protein
LGYGGEYYRKGERHLILHLILIAYRAGGFELIERLMKVGGRLDHRDAGGNTLLHLAAGGRGRDYDALVEAGADPTVRNCVGVTAKEIWEMRGLSKHK